nr:retrovirus-related Pol polyprotein from transposon TNT 1-94 [Tanacetum cinerariifolium]
MHDDVQPNYVVDSHTNYTSDSNIISYDQYVKDNAVPVVQSNVSSVSNDACMMILNDMHEQPTQHVIVTTQNNVVDKSLIAKLATYKEQVELYERRAKFKLTEREQKIDEQLRIVITDHNIKKEILKKELHSIKMKLTSTINHNKSMENGVALDEDQLLFISGGQDNVVDEDVDEQPVQDLALNVDNMFQANDCDAFDPDVDKTPTVQTMFMENLSFVNPMYDEADPSY